MRQVENKLGIQKHPVVWLCNVLGKRTPKRPANAGLCGYSKRCFSLVRDSLHVLIVKDIYVGEDCEEAGRCLDLGCDKNTTTCESYCKAYRIGRTEKVWREEFEARLKLARAVNEHLPGEIKEWDYGLIRAFETPPIYFKKAKEAPK